MDVPATQALPSIDVQAATGTLPPELARASLLLTRGQAATLLTLVHETTWQGTMVREIAPVIAQLESLAGSRAVA